MSKRLKKDSIKINFVGNNSHEVTGSMTLVNTEDCSILIDCGLYQSNSTKNDFIINSKLPKEVKSAIKKDLQYVMVTHLNIDHCGLLPLLINQGFEGEIIMPNKSKEIARKMLLDGYHIMTRDAESLGKSPYYTKEDVYQVIDKVYEIPLCRKIDLDEKITIEARSAGHLIGSAQFKIKIKTSSGATKSILATGDLGSKYAHNPLLEPLQPFYKADIVIGECTYGDPDKSVNRDTRAKDIEKLDCVIEEATRVGANVLIPSFSFGRTQQIVYELWKMYKDADFPYKVVIDSPLSCELTEVISEIEDSGLLKEVLQWDNLILSREHKTHLALMTDKRPKIIVASSGFMKFGRSVSWAQYMLPRKNNVLCFVGYSSETSLAGKIKSGQKQITIAGKKYKNKAEVINLRSFSSHMQSEELLDYYSSINSTNICLVHGDMNTKMVFANLLKERFEKQNKTTKVTVVNKGTTVTI